MTVHKGGGSKMGKMLIYIVHHSIHMHMNSLIYCRRSCHDMSLSFLTLFFFCIYYKNCFPPKERDKSLLQKIGDNKQIFDSALLFMELLS